MGAVYEVYLYSNTGTQLACLTKRLTRLEWSRVVNDQGSFAFTISDRLKPVDTSLFQLNGRVAIYRKPSPFDVSRLEMVGFIRGWDFETDGRGVTRYTWHGPDQNCLLNDRVVHPMFNTFWAPYFDSYIDTMMRQAVERNNGSTTESALRKITTNTAGLTITTESSATATSCTTAGIGHSEAGGKSLLRVLQEMHKASLTYKQPSVGTVAVPVFFDMCADAHDSFTFRTFANRRGMNHRSDSGNAVHIGTRYGNLSQPRWQHDRTQEVNAGLGVYYGMSYSGSEWALDQTRIDQAPLNRREAGVMASEDLTGAATTLINDGKPKPRFSGKVQSTPACRYGLHWGFGDELTIDYLEKQYNVRITGISATVYSGREILEPTMEVLDT